VLETQRERAQCTQKYGQLSHFYHHHIIFDFTDEAEQRMDLTGGRKSATVDYVCYDG
jgi:hypothetical protein